MRIATALVLLTGFALAAPPRTPGYSRHDTLAGRLRAKRDNILRRQEFEKKPRIEKMVLLFAASAEKFEGRPLTGSYVVDSVLRWEEVRRDVPTEAGERTLQLLMLALKKRYALVVPIPKKPRYEASLPLVAALTADRRHIRQAAIRCLDAIYGQRLGYRPDDKPRDRSRMQRTWKRKIRDLR